MMARRRTRRAAVVLALVAALAAILAGCTKTVTVSYKYRSDVGWYWVCTGPAIAPCINGARYHVTRAEYGQAQVGRTYTVHIG